MLGRVVVIVLMVMCSGTGCASQRSLADERNILLETDRQWAAAAAAGDIEKLVSYWADDAVNFVPGAPVARGKKALRKLVVRNRGRAGFSIMWEPTRSVVSKSRDLGYTFGPFQLSANDVQGKRSTRRGNYVCIWQKQRNGEWKCVVESTVFSPKSTGR